MPPRSSRKPTTIDAVASDGTRGVVELSQQEPRSSKVFGRRRRMRKNGESKSNRRKNLAKEQSIRKSDEDLDPYDSDPGESYREHVKRAGGFGTKSCLKVPKMLGSSRAIADIDGEKTEATTPPSPMSDFVDPLAQIPPSLPPTTRAVRYSLRSAITDGSESQPTGPSVMERRELRPNNIHINASHWSDPGSRPYMEDR